MEAMATCKTVEERIEFLKKAKKRRARVGRITLMLMIIILEVAIYAGINLIGGM